MEAGWEENRPHPMGAFCTVRGSTDRPWEKANSDDGTRGSNRDRTRDKPERSTCNCQLLFSAAAKAIDRGKQSLPCSAATRCACLDSVPASFPIAALSVLGVCLDDERGVNLLLEQPRSILWLHELDMLGYGTGPLSRAQCWTASVQPPAFEHLVICSSSSPSRTVSGH